MGNFCHDNIDKHSTISIFQVIHLRYFQLRYQRKQIVTNISIHKLRRFGFNLNVNSTHTARTMMLDELGVLFDWVSEPDATRQMYLTAIIEDNCLQKQSLNNRRLTARHLTNLYGLDSSIAVFRALRYFWDRDEAARPILALLCASVRDSLLHDVAHHVVGLPLDSAITSKDTETWIDDLQPGRFSKATLKSAAQNINATWTQAGYLSGRVRKTRTPLKVTSGAVAYALFLAYLSGFRGRELFDSLYVRLLDCSTHDAIEMAQQASQRGWIRINRIGDTIDIRFPNLLEPQELEWINEQD